jgi:ribosome maturation factor RimP
MTEDKVWFKKMEMLAGKIIEEDQDKIVLRRRDKTIEIYKKNINRIERGG